MKSFSDLTEQEIIALAISSEEDDARAYALFANELMETYPASSKVFMEMSAEGIRAPGPADRQFTARKFGEFIPLIRRADIIGFVKHKPAWTITKLGIDAMRKRAEVIEFENYRFYTQSAERASDPAVKKSAGRPCRGRKGA